MNGQWMINYTCRRCKKTNTAICTLDLRKKMKFPLLQCEECQRNSMGGTYESGFDTSISIQCPTCDKTIIIQEVEISSDDDSGDEIIILPESVICECKTLVKF
jgi:transcription elongation factor Elf1